MSVLVVLFGVEMLNSVQLTLIQPFTHSLAVVSSALILPFDPNVIAYGKIIQNQESGFAVSIEAGCNGVEAVIMLIAAVVAFPAPWKSKVIVILGGFVAIQILNIGRIISLFYLGQWHSGIFEWAHLYIWPVMIMVDVLIVFLVWLKYLHKAEMADEQGIES
jgi:exosortase H (IPTLxxWG-CTERM-specific)